VKYICYIEKKKKGTFRRESDRGGWLLVVYGGEVSEKGEKAILESKKPPPTF
jgi:hypothetical protein